MRYLLLAFLAGLAPCTAFSFSSWHPIITIGEGTATSSNIGQSQNFPIQNPNTDEFYNYSVRHPTITSSLFDAFAGGEWALTSHWAIQGGVDYNQTSSFTAKGSLLQGADTLSENTYTYRYHVFTSQLLAEGKLLYTIKTRYHPYFLTGFGSTFNKGYHYFVNAPTDLTFTRLYNNGRSSSFTYALGVGADVDILPHLRFGLGYRFADLGHVQLGRAIIDTTSVSGTLSQSHLYANEFLAQLALVI